MLRGINGSGGGVPTSGSGAAGYLAKWTAATTLGGSTTTGATASPFVNATGNVGIGTASPVTKLDVAYGDYLTTGAMRIGADIGTVSTRTNATAKIGAISVPHYDSAQANILFAGIHSLASSTILYVGGGLGSMNAATTTQFYVGATNTAGAGTRIATVNTNGISLDTAAATLVFNAAVSGQGIKLATAPANTDPNTLDCYAETDVAAGYTLSGVTTTSGAITVAIRATRIGRTMTFAVSIAPAGGASLTFAAAWYLTMTGVSAPAFAGSLAVSSNDATVTRGAAWVNAVAGPTVYGSAAVLGANVSLFLNGTI